MGAPRRFCLIIIMKIKTLLTVTALTFLFTAGVYSQNAPEPQEDHSAAQIASGEVELSTTAFIVEIEPLKDPVNIDLITSDGWIISSATYRAPRSSETIVVFLHSLEGDRNDWERLHTKVDKAEYGYFMFDFRGHGLSTTTINGQTMAARRFARTGSDNEFNMMTRDISAVLEFLESKDVMHNQVILMGMGMGANLAIKSASQYPDIKSIAVLGPTLGANREILSVNSLRGYGHRPIFIAVSAENDRIFREGSLLRNVAYVTSGPSMVTYVTEFTRESENLLTARVADKIMQWIKTPVMPEVVDLRDYSPPAEPVSDEELRELELDVSSEEYEFRNADIDADMGE